MFVWLTTMPQWFQIFFIILISTAVIYVVVQLIKFLILVIKEGKLSIGNNKKPLLTISGRDELISKDDAKNYSPHRNCPHNKDIIILLNETSKLMQTKYNIIYIQQIKDQMNYVEQKTEQIKAFFQKIYLLLLEEKGSEKVVKSESFASYKLILNNIEYEIISFMRKSLRENHYADMSEQNFKIYVEEKFNYMQSSVTDMLNNLYYDEKDISREELYNQNIKSISQIKNMVFDSFSNARIIAIDNKVKLMEIDEDMEKILNKYI